MRRVEKQQAYYIVIILWLTSTQNPCVVLPYILESNPHPNLIRTSFCRFLNEKNLVRGSNPHLSFNRPLRAAPSEVARWV